jgi:hypothetical protein
MADEKFTDFTEGYARSSEIVQKSKMIAGPTFQLGN